ncbi:MAG: proline--tRNA ligase [Vampirovibrio sp.]|nr:proline--tRNA ligase [Vampirovibrio sp.]
MRMTQLLIPTLRENPADAEVVSHQLLVRAGYLRKVASGLYNYLPLMQRVLKKISQIVRDEMDATGAQELLMPILQPAELWKDSGRWEVYGKELIRLKDRHERDCVLGPTHEEVITTIAKNELASYRQLPMNLYQIQNKYRDETRPRFGLLRGREFIMKDAYSFHTSQEDLEREYQVMADAYTRIFNRCGLETRMVQSDSGAIGGNVSHEYMVLTRIGEDEQQSGENDVYHCSNCDYAANANHASSILSPANTTGDKSAAEVVDTPNATSIESLENDFNIPATIILKSLIYIVNEDIPVMVLIRGDLAVEETKLKNSIQDALEIRLATDEEIKDLTGGSAKGFVGPVELPKPIDVIADTSVLELKNFAVAFNQVDKHLVGVNWDADISTPKNVTDIRLAQVGDTCSACKQGTLEMTRGIEVGNIFQLDTKYSKMMNATYADEDGVEKHFVMGCYGIGISRTAAAAVERYHDDYGIIWPLAIAPYHVVVVPVNTEDETQMTLATQVYEQLQAAGVEIVIDDRDARAGMKFKDADLIGFPIRITAGKKAGEGLLEVKMRDQKESQDLTVEQILPFVQQQFETWKPLQQQPAAVG